MPPPIRQRIIVDTTGVRIGYKEAGEEAKKFGRTSAREVSQISQTFRRLKTAIVAAFTTGFVAKFGQAVLGLNGRLEQTLTSFKQLTGSQERAVALFKEIEQFAAATPFSQDALLKGAQQLLAYGFAANDVVKILKDVGDAAAAAPGGMEQGLERIIRSMGQIRARGKLAGEEVLQLTEAGIPALEILADRFGKTTGEVQRMISAGLVPAERAIAELRIGLGERFGGMLEAQSKTAVGLLSTLRDNARIILRDMGSALFEQVKGDLEAVAEAVRRFRESAEGEAKIRQLAASIRDLYTSLLNLSKWVARHWREISAALAGLVAFRVSLAAVRSVVALTTAFRGLGVAMNVMARHPVIAILGSLSALAAVVAVRFRNAAEDARAFNGVLDTMARRAEAVSNRFRTFSENQLRVTALMKEREIDDLRQRIQAARMAESVGLDPSDPQTGEGIGAMQERLQQLRQDLVLARQALADLKREASSPSPSGHVFGPGGRRTESAHLTQGLSVDAVETLRQRYRQLQNTITEVQAAVVSNQTTTENGFKVQATAAAVAADEITSTYLALMAGLGLSKSEMLELHASYLEIMSGIQGVADEAAEGLKDTSKGTQAVAKVLSGQLARAWARAADGAGQMLRALGLLDEKTGRVLDSARAAADAYAELMSVRQAIGAGELIGTAATLATGAAGVGLIASTIGLVSGLFSGGESQTEAIRENTRRIEDAIRELGEQMREGENVSSNLAAGIKSAFGQAQLFGNALLDNPDSRPGGNLDPLTTGYGSVLDMLDEAGLNTDDLRALWATALFGLNAPATPQYREDENGNLVEDWSRWLGGLANLETFQSLLGQAIGGIDEPGRATGSLAGLLGTTSTLFGFGAISGEDAIQRLLGGLVGLDTGDPARESLKTLTEILDELRSAASADEMRQIIADAATLSSEGSLFSGELTPAQVEDFLSAILGYLPSTGTSGETAIVHQIQQTITTFQANALIVLGEETVYQLRQINATLSGLVDVPKIGPPVLNPVSTSNSVSFGPITVNGQLSEAGIREASRQFEQHIQEKTLVRP